MNYHARVTEDGDVVLPVELARELGIEDGDSVVVEHEDGRTVLKSYRQVVKEVQARFRAMLPVEPGGSIVDELIADRRAEAAQEDAEHEAWLRHASGR